METLVIYSIGKNKELWLEEAFKEYLYRLRGRIQIEVVWMKNDQQLVKALKKEVNIVALDAQGQQFTSEKFALFFFERMEAAKGRLAFVIGGAEGLPLELKNSLMLISFSPMTFTHQIIRLVLIEQVYRSYEIARGSPYHKK